MTDDNQDDGEMEQNKSWKLGHISQLETLARELRQRAGEQWSEAHTNVEVEKARQLKDFAVEFEQRAEEKRERYEEKYNDA